MPTIKRYQNCLNRLYHHFCKVVNINLAGPAQHAIHLAVR